MTSIEAIYKLIRISLGNENDLSLPKDVCYSEVMGLSELTDVSWLVINGFQKILNRGNVVLTANPEQKKNLLQWIGAAMMTEQQSSQQWAVCQRLVDLFARHGIITVGLKGMTVAQWYPNPMHRYSCDFDCILLKEDISGEKQFAYEDGNRVVEEKGVVVDRRIYVHSIFDFRGLTVENHQYLSAVKLSKRHRELDELLRSLLMSEPLIPVLNSNLMMGAPMFNAVFLTHHAHRHMLNKCLPLKLLTDWALFVSNNRTLDWERFWAYAEQFGMLRFAQTMTRASVRLIGASLPFDLPADPEADELLEESLWDYPKTAGGQRSMFARRLGIISKLLHSRKKYKVFYDSSSLAMILAYIKGYLFKDD